MNNNHHNQNHTHDCPADDMPVIFGYTRAQAIADGVLVDLTPWAKETGFTIPVACTSAIWDGYIVPPESAKGSGQSERGRCHDLLWMLLQSIRSRKDQAPTDGEELLFFEVVFLQAPGKTLTVQLKAHCGPGDDGKPVITIMLPSED